MTGKIRGLLCHSCNRSVGLIGDNNMRAAFAYLQRNQSIKFVLHDDRAKLPTRAYPTDVGYDLYSVGDMLIPRGEFRDVPTFVSCEAPEGYWILIQGRSSTIRRLGLLVTPGVLDPSYRGQMFGGAFNLTDHDVLVEHGCRLAQAIIVPAVSIGWGVEQVESLTVTARGTNGFGSSGR